MQRQVAGVWSNKDELPVSLSGWLPSCLYVCLPVCLPACLSVCLPACLPICLSSGVCLTICLPDSLPVWLAVLQCQPVSLFAYQSAYLSVYLSACPPLSVCMLSVCLTRFLFCGITLSIRPWYNHYGWLGVKKQFLFPSFHGFGVPKGRHCFDLMLSGCKKQFPFPSFHGFCLPKGRHCFYLTCVLRACLCVCVCVCVCVCSCCVLNFETMSI